MLISLQAHDWSPAHEMHRRMFSFNAIEGDYKVRIFSEAG